MAKCRKSWQNKEKINGEGDQSGGMGNPPYQNKLYRESNKNPVKNKWTEKKWRKEEDQNELKS